MEFILCPLCESKEYNMHFKPRGTDEYKSLIGIDDSTSSTWVRCNKCNLIYHQPQLSNKELENLYNKFRDYTIRGETPDEYFDRITHYPPEASENYQKIQWIIKSLPSDVWKQPINSIFDIGCGGGVFLWTARELMKPHNIIGLEPTKSFANLASRRLDTRIFNQVYESPVESFGKHDLITVNQVLEHVKMPKRFVKNLKKNLKKGGYIYIEVPSDVDFENLPADHDRFKSQHLLYFSERSLVSLFEGLGFDCMGKETVATLRGRHNIQAIFIARDQSKT